ncbi:unnamed protein product [Psylliodes chrysocephalus]|uniref:Uncharacterized protein n=1 Tax=Psylliodes chrysocephalus TaxID=3402493 RepID=A0A9P0G4E9_9CUCU|nr:unnamed protein product [Psylliodes chrysocephala]
MCQLHIFQYLDEETSKPRVYSGAIGKMLEFCEKLPVVNFVPNVSPLPESDAAAIRNLSTDQKYLYEMCHLISRGNCSLNLVVRNLAPPLLSTATDVDIREFINDTGICPVDFLSFSCHTQAIERRVKVVTEASNSVISYDSRDGFICAMIHSRTILPQFNTMAEYNA